MQRLRFFLIREPICVRLPFLGLVLLCCIFTACNKSGSKGSGQGSLDQAISEYKKARQHLLEAYDGDIESAKSDTNRVAQLKKEKAVYASQNTPVESGMAIAGLDREQILNMLHGRTWYWHWESRRKDLPFEFRVLGDDQIIGATPPYMKAPKPWKLELRWTLDEGSHLLVPFDENTLKGFFKSSGRQVGAFAEKQK